MELINATRMVAGYNMGVEVSGRELLVVVIKGTFVLPKPGGCTHHDVEHHVAERDDVHVTPDGS